ncbi:4-hydroxythreonine-4-phosphate dehydrogenase PdxA [Pelagibacteraceae bacterium]|nr:4-hydroxythreonine-4-phosphate dehydrogenase PdxA [Pelagibacteraceae bacterium]
MKKNIIILSGDPNSINSELIFKTFVKLSNKDKKKIYVITNFDLFKAQLNRLNYSLNLIKVNGIKQNINANTLKIVNVDLNFTNAFNVKRADASRFIRESLNLAHNFGLKKNVSGIVNCPINKKLLDKKYLGVTEYFASKCRVKKDTEVMLIYNENLSVSPITTHINLKNVSKKITSKIIISKILTINKQFKKIFNKKPKIGLLGLNPHNDEYRTNSEEVVKIIPALRKLKKLKISVAGPLIADTVFVKDFSKYDVLVGMYHDQVLAPFKALYKFNALNLTLGLKYLRLSPDHGTATNLIGKNKANTTSLIKCIGFLSSFNK